MEVANNPHSVPFSGKIVIALTIYLVALTASNTLGLKLMPFLFGTNLSVGVFTFPIVFVMTDIIGEVYGKKAARIFVYAGIMSIAAWLFFSLISVITPWSPDNYITKEAYESVFGLSGRIAIGSLVAFAIAEYQDVLSFFYFRKKLGRKNFWLRSNLSNIWSQLLDTVIFTLVAFTGVYSFETMLSIIIPWWLYKVAMGGLYTPLSYLGIRLLRGTHADTTN